jgi:hypothetical protein
MQTLDLTNTAGSIISLSWPAAWQLASGALPTSLAIGASIRVELTCGGTTEASIIAAFYISSVSSGLPSGGAQYSRLAKNSASNYDVGWYGPDVFNVTDWGATGNGSTDDTTPIQNAINAIVTRGRGCLYFPSPTANYKISSELVFAPTSACDISVKGDGINICSIRQVTAGARGFRATLTSGGYNPTYSIEIMDISFYADEPTGAACGEAVLIDYGTTSSSFHSECQTTISSVGVYRQGAGYWANGVILQSAWNTKIEGLYAAGNSYTGKGLQFLYKCVNNIITDTALNAWGTGFYCQNTGAGLGSEGFQLSGITMVPTNIGFDFDNSSASVAVGWICINNSHVDARGSGSICLRATMVETLQVVNSLFISGGDGSGASSRAIQLLNCVESTINGNEFYLPAGDYGVEFGSYGGVGCLGCTLVANAFRGANTNVYLDSNSRYNTVSKNVRTDGTTSPSYARAITCVDDGQHNLTGDSFGLTGVFSLSGGSSSESFNVDITDGAFGSKLNGVTAQITSAFEYDAVYNWDDAGNSKTNAVITVFKRDGSSTSGGAVRYSAVANSNR